MICNRKLKIKLQLFHKVNHVFERQKALKANLSHKQVSTIWFYFWIGVDGLDCTLIIYYDIYKINILIHILLTDDLKNRLAVVRCTFTMSNSGCINVF